MKKLLILAGAVLVLMNVGILFAANSEAKLVVQVVSGLCGLGVIVLALVTPPEVKPGAVKLISSVPVTPPPRPEAEIVALLALLQEKGRLVDFLREEIASASDEQVGAAARVVHSGCRKVLDEYFEIGPVRSEPEGTKIVLSPGYDAAAHRLLGSVSNQPPYSGKLVHPGWAVRSVKLPRLIGITEERPWPVLAPAEIQLS
jgi:hypothetical protein